MTYTYAILDVSAATYDEIRAKLAAGGYHEAFNDDGEVPAREVIDLHGLALRRLPEPHRPGETPICPSCGCAPCARTLTGCVPDRFFVTFPPDRGQGGRPIEVQATSRVDALTRVGATVWTEDEWADALRAGWAGWATPA